MNRFKTVAAVFLVIVLLIGGAFIPQLVSCLMDRYSGEDGNLRPMLSVELDMTQPLSPMGKLAMMSKLETTIPIQESKAKMTTEEAMDAFYRAITPYTDSQLVVCKENYVEIMPYLTQTTDMPELQRVVWLITLVGENTDYTYLHVVLDDESGSILLINYAFQDESLPMGRDETLQLVADIFFSGVGVEHYGSFLVKDMEYANIGDDANACCYRLRDVSYGQIDVNFYVHSYGFYIEFPDM